MNHARITHRFSFLRGACVVCVIRRWNERGPSVIVSVCASKAVCAFFEFWTVQNFSDAQLCVGVRNSCVGVRCLCVEYAWLCAGHASAVSAYASELVLNRARPRPSTDAPRSYHAWTAHISRSFHWHPRNESACTWYVHEACVFGRAPSVIHASGVRRMFVEYIDHITWCFQYPPWYLAEVSSICPRSKAEGKYGTEAKYQGGYWKCQVMLYLLHTCTVFIWHLSDFVYNKISPRQSRHTNPGGLHVMTGELSEIINMTIVFKVLIHFVDNEWHIVYINKCHCNLTKQ